MFTPENDTVPTAYCFWYITRRRFYKNDYERELAELTQNYGQSIWQGYLNGEKIQDIAADLAAEIDRAQNAENNLDAAIKAETARAQAAESQLDTKIEAETSRAEAAEKALDDKITAETERATAEEARLDAKIDAETERATGVEADLQQQITAEVTRAKAREDKIASDLADEVNRATLEENRLNGLITTETQRAKDAEAVLQTNIDNEQQAREDADTALGARIDSLSSDVTQQINDFKTEVNGKLDSMESTISQMQTTVGRLTTQVDNLSQNVTNLSGAVSTMQNTVNTLQQNFTSLTEAVAGINDELDKIQSGDLDLPYLKRGGDTGTGTFNFTGATVNVAAPTADANAATKKYVDDADKVNAAAIAAETERATNKENELNTAITAEKERAEAAESSLSGLINQETTDRKAADNALETKITQEVEDRTEADNAIKQEIANLTNGTTAMPYVKKSGDTMSGVLDMQNHKVTNVAAPTETADAANKGYVDTAIRGLTNGTTAMPYVKKAGDTMSGNLSMGNHSITQAYGIQLSGDNPKAFINSNGEAAIASLATPNNYNVLNVGAPVKDTHAATKKYVDDKDAELDAAIKKEVQDRETAISGIQTEIDGVSGDLSGYLPLTGGTMTGALNVQTPTENTNAATKAYVDQAVQNATDPELEGRVEALETSQATQDTEIANLKNGTTALPYVKKAGDSMSGVLNMSNNKITNVADPTANGDAVNYKTMNAMKTDLESQIENLSGLLDAANQKIQDLEQRVEELENNPPQPVDPTTKFNQIDLSNYVGSLSGSTVNTASDFKAALQYILNNNSGKHFYYGTDHAGTTWYFASDTELSALSNDSYTCGNGVRKNSVEVRETFKMNKYVEPMPNLPDESGDYTEYKHTTTLSDAPEYKQTIINTMRAEQGSQSNPFKEYAMNIQKVTPTQLNTILNSANLFGLKRKQIAKSDPDHGNPGVWYGYGATDKLKSLIHDGDTVYWLEDWEDYGNNHGSDNVFFIMIPTDDGNWRIATLWGTHD